MAVELVATDANLYRLVGPYLDPTLDLTMVVWDEPITANPDPGDYRTFWSLTNLAGTYYIFFGQDDAGHPWLECSNNSDPVEDLFGAVMAPDVWKAFAITYKASTTTFTLYLLSGGVATVVGSFVLDMNTANTIEFESIGDVNVLGARPFATGYFRSWQALKTPAQIAAEMQSQTIVSSTGLFTNTPLLYTGNINDISGNGHDWTAANAMASVLGPFAPANTSAATATAIGAVLPATIVQDVNGALAPTYEVWFKRTAQVGEIMNGIWAKTPVASNYEAQCDVFEGTPPGVTPYLSGLGAYRVPLQVPVTPPDTLYYRVRNQGVTVPLDESLTFSAVPEPALSASGKTILFTDFEPGFPASLMQVSLGAIGQFIRVPTADFGDRLTDGSGIFAFADNSTTPQHLKLFDAAYALIADLAGLFTAANIYNQVRENGDRFYVGSSTAIANATIYAIGMAGATLGTWTLNSNSRELRGIAASRDNTILYFTRLNGTGSALHRWDLVNNIALADLVAALPGYSSGKDLLVLPDESILMHYLGAPSLVKHISPAGAILGTYSIANLDRINIDPLDTLTTFWAVRLLSPQVVYEQIRLSDGAVVDTFPVPMFLAGVSNEAFAASMSRFGNSNSCPLMVILAPGNALRLTQLPIEAAYDYAMLQPYLGTQGLRWATPPRS